MSVSHIFCVFLITSLRVWVCFSLSLYVSFCVALPCLSQAFAPERASPSWPCIPTPSSQELPCRA